MIKSYTLMVVTEREMGLLTPHTNISDIKKLFIWNARDEFNDS